MKALGQLAVAVATAIALATTPLPAAAQLAPAPAPAPAPLATPSVSVSQRAPIVAQATPAAAQPTPAPTSAPAPLTAPGTVNQRALVDITVNTVDQGIHTVLIGNGDIAVSRDDLSSLGLAKIATIFGSGTGPYVSLNALRAGLSYAFNQSTLTLAITVQPQYLSSASVTLNPHQAYPLNRISSAFINYGLLMTQGEPGDLSTQLGSTLGPGVFSATFNDIGQAYRMTDVFWRLDDPASMRSLIVGDSYNDLGDLSGSALMRGLTYERNFSLNPYFSRLVAHSLAGYAATPSTAFIYINGQLVDQVDLAPGAFNITNLPELVGITNARVVIRDAFGNTQVFSQTYYEGLQVLPVGVDSFTYSVGDPQDGIGHSIGPDAAVAEYSRGISNVVTLGGRAEYSEQLLNGGPTIALTTRFGEFDLIGLGSSGQGYSGSAAEAVYNYLASGFDFNATYQTQTPNYANITQLPTQDRLTESLVAGIGFQIFKNQFLNLQLTDSQDRDLGHLSGYAAQTTFELTRNLSLLLDFEHEQGYEGTQNDFYTSLLFPIGQDTFVSVTQDGSTTGGNTSYEVDRPSRPDSPLGYTFSDTAGSDQNQVFDQVSYEAPFGQYYVQHTGFEGVSSNEVDIAGAIDFADRSVMFSRPIDDGYAVVDTGVPGVPVYVNGIWVGKTNGAGLLANPDVIPYAQNEVTLDTSALPLNLNFNTTSQTLAMPFLTAGLVSFRPERIKAFLGSVVVIARGKSVVPQYGVLTLQVDNSPQASELGDNGEFYLTNLAAGVYPARVSYTGGTCDFTVTIPQTADFYVRLGQLTCTTSSASSSPSPHP